MSIQDLIPFHSFSPLKQSQSLEYQRSIMIYHVVSMVLPTCSLQRRGLSNANRSWPLRHDPMGRGHPVSFNVWGRGCKRYVERKVFWHPPKRQSERRKWAVYQFVNGLHFTFCGWTLDFPDASISLAVGDKIDQVCLKLLDSQLGEWRGCLWTATEVIYIYIYVCTCWCF